METCYGVFYKCVTDDMMAGPRSNAGYELWKTNTDIDTRFLTAVGNSIASRNPVARCNIVFLEPLKERVCAEQESLSYAFYHLSETE